MITNNNEPKTHIICSGDNSGNIETLDYRCPKKGKQQLIITYNKL